MHRHTAQTQIFLAAREDESFWAKRTKPAPFDNTSSHIRKKTPKKADVPNFINNLNKRFEELQSQNFDVNWVQKQTMDEFKNPAKKVLREKIDEIVYDEIKKGIQR